MDSLPTKPSSTAVTLIVPDEIFKSSLQLMPSLKFALILSEPVPFMVKSSLLNIAAFGSSSAALSYRYDVPSVIELLPINVSLTSPFLILIGALFEQVILALFSVISTFSSSCVSTIICP
jgi:DMSO reductase anchor subunit